MTQTLLIKLLLVASLPCGVFTTQQDNRPAAPATLPGNGLAQHSFVYTGEAKSRKVFVVRNGKVDWEYEETAGRGEISDVVMLSNGNILLAHQYAIKLISPDKKVLWNLDAPLGTEIHTAVPIGFDHVLYIQNSITPTVNVMNIKTGELKLTFPLVANPKEVHVQFRHARLTPQGTLLVAHKDQDKVSEYNAKGEEIWTIHFPEVWGAEQQPDGHILISSHFGVREVTRDKKVVFSITREDLPDYKIYNWQLCWRLPNGNTVFNNWINSWSQPDLLAKGDAVQLIELDPRKKVVWALRAWNTPNLGPATAVQFLDKRTFPERVHFGVFK